jgi:hypothetical protein
MFHLLLLAPFLVLNYVVLRWLGRRLVLESAWLFDPKQRAEGLQEYANDMMRNFPSSPLSFTTPWWSTPIGRLFTLVGSLGAILSCDYATIGQFWPWLLGR